MGRRKNNLNCSTIAPRCMALLAHGWPRAYVGIRIPASMLRWRCHADTGVALEEDTSGSQDLIRNPREKNRLLQPRSHGWLRSLLAAAIGRQAAT